MRQHNAISRSNGLLMGNYPYVTMSAAVSPPATFAGEAVTDIGVPAKG